MLWSNYWDVDSDQFGQTKPSFACNSSAQTAVPHFDLHEIHDLRTMQREKVHEWFLSADAIAYAWCHAFSQLIDHLSLWSLVKGCSCCSPCDLFSPSQHACPVLFRRHSSTVLLLFTCLGTTLSLNSSILKLGPYVDIFEYVSNSYYQRFWNWST